MKIIIILVCLAVQRFLNVRVSIADYDWFKPYLGLVRKMTGGKELSGYDGLAFTVLPIVLLLGVFDLIFGMSPILSFVYALLIVFYCLDGRDMAGQLKACLGGGEGDARKEVVDFAIGTVPESPNGQARAVSNSIFQHSLHLVFAVLFWYWLLGVFGAILYYVVRLVWVRASSSDAELVGLTDSSALVLGVLDWVPVRLAGVSYALVGAFGNVFSSLMKNIVGGLNTGDKLSAEFGLVGISADPASDEKADVEENKSALELVFRAQIVWVVVIGVFVLLAMAF